MAKMTSGSATKIRSVRYWLMPGIGRIPFFSRLIRDANLRTPCELNSATTSVCGERQLSLVLTVHWKEYRRPRWEITL